MHGGLVAICNVESGFQDLKMKIQMLNEQAELQLCDGSRHAAICRGTRRKSGCSE